QLYAIGSEGVIQSEIARRAITDDALGRAFDKGETYVDVTRDTSTGSLAEPACVIPLYNDGIVVGVIAVFQTLEQKTEFGRVDRELFKLLGAQAAPALCNAHLYTAAGRNMPGLEAFLGLEDT